MKDTYNDSEAIEIAPGIYHLGVQDIANSFNNIPYLIVDGDEAVIIDPGSAKPDFLKVVIKKIKSVIDMKIIKHVVVQHQDPDLCAAVPIIEKDLHPDVKVHAPLEAKVLIQHYGFNAPMVPLDDDDTLTFGNDRTLHFAMTPYCHFVGSMVTYDIKTKTLFSSDAFGGFTGEANLFAEVDYPAQLSAFLGQYLGSKKAFEYALKRIELLDKTHGIELICPQHGCIIPKGMIAAYIKAAHELHIGGEVDALAAKHGIKLNHSW